MITHTAPFGKERFARTTEAAYGKIRFAASAGTVPQD